MAHRGTEAPMDFQYDHPRVPADPNSPFTRFTALKRTHSDLRSPTPNPPALAPPNSERFLFPRSAYPGAPPQPPPPPPQFRRVSTTTPRSAALDMSDFTDPDLFTPGAPKLTFRSSHAPTTTTTTTATTTTPRGRYHDGAITKPKRPPRTPSVKAKAKATRTKPPPDWSDSDTTTTSPPQPPPRSSKRWADNHRDVPLIMSQYVQLFFNTALALLFLYALLSAYATVRRDVSEKLSTHSAALVAAANDCAHQFLINRCAPSMRVPALAAACADWERCMTRDHTQVGRAKLSAQTFAEIIESFIDPVSYRTMGFALVLALGAVFVPNAALGLYRARALGHPAPVLAAVAPPLAGRFVAAADDTRRGRGRRA